MSSGVTLFVSDLHLAAERPNIVRLFAEFLHDEASHAEAVYILGDLFEYWIGDDQPTAGLEPVLEGFLQLKTAGVPGYFIHGNRDFLLGAHFAERYGLRLLPEAAVINLHGTPTLLMHGDTLCTDDLPYQQMRQMLRNPAWQAEFLALPLPERIRQALALRERSASETQDKAESIMDVNAEAVTQTLREHGVNRLIHGHTHRPATHTWQDADGATCHRIVLGDWYARGSVLRCAGESLTLDVL